MSLKPDTHNFNNLKRGSTWDPVFTWQLQDEAGNLTPMNLTGWQGRMQIRKKEGTEPDFEVPITILSPATEGRFRAKLFPSQTMLIPAGGWAYDVEFFRADPETPSEQEVRCPVEGKIKVSANITT